MCAPSLKVAILPLMLLTVQITFACVAVYGADERLFDFGISDPRRSVVHTYPIVNEGKEPLLIERAGVTCGCVSVRSYPDVVAPGARGDLEIALDTTGLQGYVTQTITLVTNRPQTPDIEYEIRGTVRDIWLNHSTIELGRIAYPGPAIESEIRVTSAGLDRVQITQIELPPFLEFRNNQLGKLLSRRESAVANPVRKLDVETASTGDDEATLDFVKSDRAHHLAYVFHVRSRPERIPSGPFRGKIRIQTNGASEQPLEILVSGTRVGPVYTEPAVVFLGSVSRKINTERQVRLLVTEGQQLDLKQVTVRSDHESVIPVLRTRGQETILAVEVQPGENLPRGSLSGSIDVLNAEGDVLARVRYVGFVGGDTASRSQ